MQEGQIWGREGVMGGILWGIRGTPAHRGEGPETPLTFEDEWHEGDEGGLHLGQHLPVGLVVPAGVLVGNEGVRLWGGSSGVPWIPPKLVAMGMGLVAWGRGARTPQDTSEVSPPHQHPKHPQGGGLGTPPSTPRAAPTPLTHRQVLKLPKQILEFPWELLEDKTGEKAGSIQQGQGAPKGRAGALRRFWEHPGKGQGASEGVQKGPGVVWELLEESWEHWGGVRAPGGFQDHPEWGQGELQERSERRQLWARASQRSWEQLGSVRKHPGVVWEHWRVGWEHPGTVQETPEKFWEY